MQNLTAVAHSSQPRLSAGKRTPVQETWARILRHRWIYVLLLPGFLYFVLFQYIPMLGNVIIFQDYKPFLGFVESPWVGLRNFSRLFTDPNLGQVIVNTIVLSSLQIVLAFPAPIVLALLLNEVRGAFFKRAIQSMVYLPHFISWVIIVGIWYQLFNTDGVMNQILASLGMAQASFLTNPDLFRPSFVVQTIWKESGWGTIIFLAALSGINLELYEAAAIDGASRWQRMLYITIPGIMPITMIVLILRLGSVLSVGFEHIFLVGNSSNAQLSEVLDIFIYYRGIIRGSFSFATTVGLVRGLVGMGLILSCNWLAKRFSEGGVF